MKKAIISMTCIFVVLSMTGMAKAYEVFFVINGYVHSRPFQPPDSTVMMFRGTDMEFIDRIILSRHQDAHSAAVGPDDLELWVTCREGDKVAIIDINNFEYDGDESINFAEGSKPQGIAFTPDGDHVYVTLSGTGRVSKFNAVTRAHESTFTVDPASSPGDIHFTPDGSKAYIIDLVGAAVYALRTSDDTVVQSFDFRRGAPSASLSDGVMSPDGSRFYVCNRENDLIEVIRTSDNTALTPIPVSVPYPRSIGISPDGNYLFVGCVWPVPISKVIMIRLSDNAEVAYADVPVNPRRMAVRKDGSRIFVVDHDTDEVHAYNVSGESLAHVSAVADVDREEAPDYDLDPAPIGIQIADRGFSLGRGFLLIPSIEIAPGGSSSGSGTSQGSATIGGGQPESIGVVFDSGLTSKK